MGKVNVTRLEQNGIYKPENIEELQVFIGRVVKDTVFRVMVPISICKFIGVDNGDLIVVAVKKAARNDLIEFRNTYLRSIWVKCPRCQNWGTLIDNYFGQVIIRHSSMKSHNVPLNHPNFIHYRDLLAKYRRRIIKGRI